MTAIHAELYQAFRAAGVDEDLARKAAALEGFASKQDLDAAVADIRTSLEAVKADLTWKMFLMFSFFTAVGGAIAAALKFVKP
jgi:hypothetical protein